MDIGNLPLFRLAERRMEWLDRRQQVLAQNVANADTPGYSAREITPFARLLARSAPVGLFRTSPLHQTPHQVSAMTARPERLAAERTPVANAVQVERELMKVAETETHQALTLGLFRGFAGMVRLALGRVG